MTIIKRALISVSDKRNLLEFSQTLRRFGVEILSTGGTAKLLREHGIPAIEVSDYTGFPEMLDGRVKTLHPKVHGGILGRRDMPEHMKAMQEAGIPPIDMVVVNLYPFRETIAKPDCTLEQAMENIDIGGPAMVRAAAKNYGSVVVVTDPADYAALTRELESTGGAIGAETRFRLAKKAFSHTAEYDGAISNYLTALDAPHQRQSFPDCFNAQFTKVMDLRYGENPHQDAAFYRDALVPAGALAGFTQLQGKELSYNNIADADAAWECVKTLDAPACVIVKHANPCGVAIAPDLPSAYEKAFQTDPTSAFGGIIAFNGEVGIDVIDAMNSRKHFVEVLIAPSYSADALTALAAKTNLRVLEVPLGKVPNALEYKRVGGGLLLQTPDALNVGRDQLKVVTRKQPTPEQLDDLLFAWRVAKFVKSNAIVFAGHGMTLGIGAGQMSRVDSTRIAAIKAQNAGLSLAGSAVASDAFFPFRDGVDVLAEAGASCVIQPGGSVRDAEVIAAADEHGLAMVLTGVRHFRH
jgi:phosphoribosylaminoimidazolecarboxamide formyltransferase/IMP cyclohydrolase